MDIATKKTVIATLIKAGRPDLATAMAYANTREVEARLPYWREQHKKVQREIEDARSHLNFLSKPLKMSGQADAHNKVQSAIKHLEQAASDAEILRTVETQTFA